MPTLEGGKRTPPAATGITYATKNKGGGKQSTGDGDPAELALKLRWVRGIESDLDDLVIRGQKFTSHFGDSLMTGTIVRKIAGASELTITISDPLRRILNKPITEERHELELDGLHWILAKVHGEGLGAPLVLTYEPRVVRELKLITGPIKGKREQMTRAEFAKKLTEQLPPARRPRFISPLLHVKQPIQTEAEAKKKKAAAPSERAKGLDRAGLTVKGATPSNEQYELGEMALEIAESHGAPSAVMTMVLMALIDETDMGAVQRGNVLAALEPYTQVRDAAEEISGFISGEPTWTGLSAMDAYHANPGKPLYTLVQEVQKSATADGSNYAAFEVEAAKWTAQYGGGVDSANTAEQITKKYEFSVGPEENLWKAMERLAGEVNWRCFESAGWVYFIDEIELTKQRTVIELTPYAVGLENLTFDCDEGKLNDEITVTARARAWSAPPGTMVEVTGWGTADGTYLVSQIEAPLAYKNSSVNIILKRPHKALKEPAKSTETKELGGTGGNSGTSPKSAADAPESVDKMLAAMEKYSGVPYASPGESHGATFNLDPATGDCSGMMSLVLHAGGFLEQPEVSGAIAEMYEPGKGEWFVLYANADHVWCEIRTKDGWVEWEEGGSLGGTSGFLAGGTQSPSGYAARHPKGT